MFHDTCAPSGNHAGGVPSLTRRPSFPPLGASVSRPRGLLQRAGPAPSFRLSFATASEQPVLFADLSPFVLRLFFVYKTEYNRRTIEEQTKNNTGRGEGAARPGQRHGDGPPEKKRDFFAAFSYHIKKKSYLCTSEIKHQNNMRKNILLLLTTVAMSVLFAGCANKKAYTINGQISAPEFDGLTVYLTALENEEFIDSAVVADGRFTIKGETETPRMAVLTASDPEKGIGCQSIFVLEHGKIAIDLITDSLSGTPLNDQLYNTITVNDEMAQYRQQMEEYYRQYVAAETPEARKAAEANYDQTEAKAKALTVELSRQMYTNNQDNVLGAYALHMMVENDGITFDSLDALLAKAAPAIAEYAPLREARTRLFHLDNTSVGKKYSDLQGINFATGKKTNLSNMISGKQITLLDFWASWCGPCRREISENLVPLYAKYKDKGLNIIGIDVNDDIKKHKAAVDDLGIAYPQFIDTTSNAVSTYAVQGIPQIMLLDKEGTILARDLRGTAIEEAIVEALKK